MRKNVRLIAVIIFTAIIFVAGLVFIIVKHFESRAAKIAFENNQLINNIKPIIAEQVNNINNESPGQIPTAMPAPYLFATSYLSKINTKINTKCF